LLDDETKIVSQYQDAEKRTESCNMAPELRSQQERHRGTSETITLRDDIRRIIAQADIPAFATRDWRIRVHKCLVTCSLMLALHRPIWFGGVAGGKRF
jgi:hypothetical protein